MRPGTGVIVGLFVFAISVGAYLILNDKQPAVDEAIVSMPSYPVERNIRYSYTIKNVSGKFIDTASFWTYAPVKQTSTQRTLEIQTSAPYMVEVDQAENQRLLFSVNNLPPYGTRVVTINVRLGMSPIPHPYSKDDTTDFLDSGPYVETESPGIVKLAQQLAHDDPNLMLASTYDWIRKNLKDVGYVKNDRGAAYALESRSGDCTEYMYLYMALSRSNAIPTRGVSGFVVTHDKVLRAIDYHNWTVAFVDGYWQLIDPHQEVFMANQANYIAMRLLGGPEEGSAVHMQSQTLFGVGPGIEVVMN